MGLQHSISPQKIPYYLAMIGGTEISKNGEFNVGLLDQVLYSCSTSHMTSLIAHFSAQRFDGSSNIFICLEEINRLSHFSLIVFLSVNCL